VKRSKEEVEADPEEEDEFGYTTSEYKGYVLPTVTVDLSCFICVMYVASACSWIPFLYDYIQICDH
jgi:hypothetical protein